MQGGGYSLASRDIEGASPTEGLAITKSKRVAHKQGPMRLKYDNINKAGNGDLIKNGGENPYCSTSPEKMKKQF